MAALTFHADAATVAATPRAVHLGVQCCHLCGWTGVLAATAETADCPRCHAAVYRRKPASVARAWAWLIAAAVMYIPANLLPVMQTQTLVLSSSNTLLGGIAELWNGGAWDLALIVFVASIAVPLTKLLCLAYLLVGVQRRSCWHPRARTRLYRTVDFIGHWSMLDIFVISLLAALVQLGGLAQVRPEPGAVAFAAVVILTMIASMSFDSRLIWDALDTRGRTGDAHG
ncbi:MAG TPA: paraquat-inducible protein A [Nevskiaceae bacterium]|nr:paraquat-inducible protein A [Nevskiaceae bacterium]